MIAKRPGAFSVSGGKMRALPLVSVATAIGTLLVTGNVLAQQATATANAGTADLMAGAVAGNSDHDAMVGRLGVGYLGRRTVAVGAGGAVDGMAPEGTVDAPVVGVRIWLNPMVGIDAGLGLAITSGSSEIETAAGTVSADNPSTLGFILHGGVPLSLAADNHYSFQIIPELNIGYASISAEDAAGNSIDQTGLHFDIGARAGAEIHFGFMGIPQLSLQGSVGLRIDYDTSSTDNGATNQTFTWSQTRVSTTTFDNPWNIFVSNVAAIYYF